MRRVKLKGRFGPNEHHYLKLNAGLSSQLDCQNFVVFDLGCKMCINLVNSRPWRSQMFRFRPFQLCWFRKLYNSNIIAFVYWGSADIIFLTSEKSCLSPSFFLFLNCTVYLLCKRKSVKYYLNQLLLSQDPEGLFPCILGHEAAGYVLFSICGCSVMLS